MKKPEFGPLSAPHAAANSAAIVFIHGFTGDWKSTWGSIPSWLTKHPQLNGWDLFGFGYSSRRRFDLLGLWSADAAIPQIAVLLSTMLQQQVPASKYRAVALIAHSMGGLVLQEAWTKDPNLRNRASHIILFGTPSAGLVKASTLASAKQQIDNMRPNSPFIAQLTANRSALNIDATPALKFFAVAGELDQFVPPSSSIEPFREATRHMVPGNHVTMLDVESAQDPTIKLIVDALTEGAALSGPRNSANIAAEIGNFSQLVQQHWPPNAPMPEKLDDIAAVDLAIALERLGRTNDALALLKAHKPQGADVLGVLAGRLKRRWLVSRQEEDYQSSLKLYKMAFEKSVAQDDPDQAYYHGINLLFLELAHYDNYSKALDTAKQRAAAILGYCERAQNTNLIMWRLATEGDAFIVQGDWPQALSKHRAACQHAQAPWQALSMEEQSIRLARLLGRSESEINDLADIYEGRSGSTASK